MNRARPRFVLYVMPAAAVFAAAFGVVYGWIGVKSLLIEPNWLGALLLVFGFGGLALGVSLWRAWRLVSKRAGGG